MRYLSYFGRFLCGPGPRESREPAMVHATLYAGNSIIDCARSVPRELSISSRVNSAILPLSSVAYELPSPFSTISLLTSLTRSWSLCIRLCTPLIVWLKFKSPEDTLRICVWPGVPRPPPSEDDGLDSSTLVDTGAINKKGSKGDAENLR